HELKYENYVGDGDSKTFKAILDSQHYGNFTIKKKECIEHVQKRMGRGGRKGGRRLIPRSPHLRRKKGRSRTCALRAQRCAISRERRRLNPTGRGRKGKLTGKLIDELSIYYGLAIRRNHHSDEKMRNEIYTTL
ncbi:hypothetical protein EAI_01300, partial [Harpegnathos saltator]